MVGYGGFVATRLFFHVFPLDVSLGRLTLKLIWWSSTWSRGVDYLDMKVAGNIIVQHCCGIMMYFGVLWWVMMVLRQPVCFSNFFPLDVSLGRHTLKLI